jgi:hypothetical protein
MDNIMNTHNKESKLEIYLADEIATIKPITLQDAYDFADRYIDAYLKFDAEAKEIGFAGTVPTMKVFLASLLEKFVSRSETRKNMVRDSQ